MTEDIIDILGPQLNLSSELIEAWKKHPALLEAALKNVLDREIIDGVAKPFVVWKTITVGGKTNVQLAEEMVARGICFDEELLSNFPEELRPYKARLAKVSYQELGFVKVPYHKDFLQRGKDLGLTYHAAVAPYLRLQYLEQEGGYDHLVTVAMESIEGKLIQLDHCIDVGVQPHGLCFGDDCCSDDERESEYAPYARHENLVFIIGEMEPIE